MKSVVELLDFNIDELNKEINEKWIRVQSHPELDLNIYNYTEHAQFERYWNKYTINCRGLILDSNYNLIARPFPKFWNLEELPGLNFSVPNLPFDVYDKVDGSLGILFHYNNQMIMATRGSFQSEQAIKGLEMYHELYNGITLNTDHVYLFEIIYPENRIVVDYGTKKRLVLLGIYDRTTGQEVSLLEAPEGLEVIHRYDGITDVNKIIDNFSRTNIEGFVVRYSNGFRVKLKTEEYRRLHKIMTNVSEKSVWEVLSNNQSLDEFIKNVPDEFYQWVTDVKNRLEIEYKVIEETCRQLVNEIGDKDTRKDLALEYMKFPEYYSIMFMMKFGSDYSSQIWKKIKPSGETKFKIGVEEDGG